MLKKIVCCLLMIITLIPLCRYAKKSIGQATVYDNSEYILGIFKRRRRSNDDVNKTIFKNEDNGMISW